MELQDVPPAFSDKGMLTVIYTSFQRFPVGAGHHRGMQPNQSGRYLSAADFEKLQGGGRGLQALCRPLCPFDGKTADAWCHATEFRVPAVRDLEATCRWAVTYADKGCSK